MKDFFPSSSFFEKRSSSYIYAKYFKREKAQITRKFAMLLSSFFRFVRVLLDMFKRTDLKLEFSFVCLTPFIYDYVPEDINVNAKSIATTFLILNSIKMFCIPPPCPPLILIINSFMNRMKPIRVINLNFS